MKRRAAGGVRLPLVERKATLRRIVRKNDRVRYVEHIEDRGIEFFRAACNMEIEGVVCKWRHGIYQIGGSTTSWLKLKNARYSQAAGRSELFALAVMDKAHAVATSRLDCYWRKGGIPSVNARPVSMLRP